LLPDQNSEFEIQTEASVGTVYLIAIYVDIGSVEPAQPSIILRHQGSGNDEFQVQNSISRARSAEPNKYGKGNILVTLS
jgi:hypothetical protein